MSVSFRQYQNSAHTGSSLSSYAQDAGYARRETFASSYRVFRLAMNCRPSSVFNHRAWASRKVDVARLLAAVFGCSLNKSGFLMRPSILPAQVVIGTPFDCICFPMISDRPKLIGLGRCDVHGLKFCDCQVLLLNCFALFMTFKGGKKARLCLHGSIFFFVSHGSKSLQCWLAAKHSHPPHALSLLLTSPHATRRPGCPIRGWL